MTEQTDRSQRGGSWGGLEEMSQGTCMPATWTQIKVVNEARGERAGWRRAKEGKWWTSLVVSTIKKIILFMKEKEYVKNV